LLKALREPLKRRLNEPCAIAANICQAGPKIRLFAPKTVPTMKISRLLVRNRVSVPTEGSKVFTGPFQPELFCDAVTQPG